MSFVDKHYEGSVGVGRIVLIAIGCNDNPSVLPIVAGPEEHGSVWGANITKRQKPSSW